MECGEAFWGCVHPTMTLQGGRRLGPYEILRPVGAGGMGEVYRARDSRLDREVAVKVLPTDFALDHERLARFEREARAASALNHPNICTIHDVGEHDGVPYLVMELLDGQSLKDRIDAGPVATLEILDVGIDVADALTEAHAAGIVHRDIKPDNIYRTERGQAKVLDFGIARIDEAADDVDIDLEAPTMEAPDLTRPGAAIGTVSYMSPEQVLGKRAGSPTDVFSLGVVLYEMATGSAPFSGRTSGAIFDQIVHSAPTSPVSINRDLPRELERIINRCLDKDPSRRCTAAELRDGLDELRRSETGGHPAFGPRFRRLARRPAFWLAAVAGIAAVAVGAVRWSGHQSEVRKARGEVLPELTALSVNAVDSAQIMAGVELIRQVESLLDDDPEFVELRAKFFTSTDIDTDPPGADVWVKPYTDPDAPWEHLGTTPVDGAELPSAYFRWKIEKSGYEQVLDARHASDFDFEKGVMKRGDRSWALAPAGSRPKGMVVVPGNDEVPEFLVDRHEVTNREFKEFVSSGGYQTTDYWQHEFVLEGRVIDRDEALAMFVDQTGRPGPATWDAGDFPDGLDDYPVTGVSWYEAAAYAEFAGKSLPTIDHWYRARGTHVGVAQWVFTGLLMPMSNFGGDGPMAAGSSHAMTPLGAEDMAGNVREWCFNSSPAGRCLRGGAWNDASYMFENVTQADPFDRTVKNGFRCVKLTGETAVPEDLFDPYAPAAKRDLMTETPVADEIFEAYLAQYAYDPTPLQSSTDARNDRSDDWIRESVSYAAAYGDERVTAQLFLPKNMNPPYQAVVYFPGSGAFDAKSTELVEQRGEFQSNVAFLLKTGRAVLYPAYRGTHERKMGIEPSIHWSMAPTIEHSNFQINLIKDVMRSVDYLQSRPDIQGDKIAFFGFSWGGIIANLALAVEDRFEAAVLNVGGMNVRDTPRPEVDYINFAPRITVPVLMLNGRFDLALLYEAEVKPMHHFLGTPDEHKRLIVYETDHWIDNREVARETLAWFDRYLGPVSSAK
jgi:dienelactone hydrolase